MTEKRRGKEDWRATDARLAEANLDGWVGLTPKQRGQLDEAARLNREAAALNQEGRAAEAVDPASRAMALCGEVLGPTHPAYATSLNDLAALYRAGGQLRQGRTLYRQALEIRKLGLGREAPRLRHQPE